MPNFSWEMPDAEHTARRAESRRKEELSKQASEMAETLADDILTQCQSKGFTEKQVEQLADYLKWKITRTLSDARDNRKFEL